MCTPEVVSYWVKQKIKELYRQGKSIVMAGSPRTLFEAKDQLPILKRLFGLQNIKAVLIEISPQETIWRNSHRRICELVRHPILYTPETKKLKICPIDGSKLVKREGLDTPQTIKIRIKEYQERTFPVIEYIQQQGVKVNIVNGAQPVKDVFEDILKVLSLKTKR